MVQPQGDIGTGIVYKDPSYCPLRGPYMWYNSRDWVAGPKYPFGPAQIADNVIDYQGYIPNKGISGPIYNAAASVRRNSFVSTDPPPFNAYTYRIAFDLFMINWAPPNTNSTYDDPAHYSNWPNPSLAYTPHTLMTDLGGPFVAGGPLCAVNYFSDQHDPHLLFLNGDSWIDAFDFIEGNTHFINHNDLRYPSNEGYEMFQEWFDYVTAGFSNFNEIRGPGGSSKGLTNDDFEFKLGCIWEDCANGVGDILLDRHSFWEDPTYEGRTSEPRGQFFWKVDSPEIGVNQPDLYYQDFVDTNSRLNGYETSWPSMTFDVLPVPGSMFPAFGGMALFRGVPTKEELDQIRADMIAGGTPTYFRVHPPINPSSITTTGHMSDTRSDVCWSSELGIFVAVGGNAGRATTSPDGITWTDRTGPTVLPSGVCWSPDLGLFVMVGSSGVGSKISTSPDGINWTGRTAPGGLSPSKVCWAPALGLFCIAGTFSGATNIATSPDGINWTLRTNSPNSNRRAICWSPQLHLFCSVGLANSCSTSPDGINWTSRAIGSTSFGNNYLGVCWSPKRQLFVVVGDGTQFKTSPDGITWTTRSIVDEGAIDWHDVCWGADEFIAIGYSGSFPMAYSKDGINWQGYSFSAGQWEGIAYSPELGKYVCVESGSPYGVVTIP